MERGLTQYKGKPCSKGHSGVRGTASKTCVICHRQSVNKYLQKEEVRDYVRKYRLGRFNEAKKRKYRVNRQDPEWVEKERARGRARYQANKDASRANRALRRAQELLASPPWLTQEHKQEIREIYAAAKRHQQATGSPHHVDHIHPLRGENFCGLHVPWNLCIITDRENMSKGNRLPPDAPTW
jgi:hypothetical protein